MARTYEVVLDINGRLGNLQSAISGAQRSLQSLGRSAAQSSVQASRATRTLQTRLSDLNRNLDAARRFRQLNSSISDFNRQTAEARQNAARLYSAMAAQERQVSQMRESFSRLQTARNNRQISAGSLTQGRQELRAAEQGLRQLQSQYRHAQADADSLNSALRRQTSELNSLRSAFQEAGVGAENLSRHEAEVQSQIDTVEPRLRRSQAGDEARGRISVAAANVSDKYANFQNSVETARSIISPFKAAIDVAKDFEFEMSNVKSLTQMRNIRAGNFDEVNKSMAALTAQAKELGKTTEYTAIQAAQMQGKLAMSGWTDKNILAAGQSIMDLATATKVDLPVAADIASDLIQAFGLKVGDTVKVAGKEYDAAKHFVDTFAYATTSANTDVQGFKDTFKYAAPITKQWGLSLHEAAAAAMVTANSSIKGSQAGTAFKTGLLRLAGPPKAAGKALEEMGLSASDATKMMEEANAAMQNLGIDTNFAEGTSEGQKFTSLMQQMNEKFKGMDVNEKLSNLNAIFGSEATPFWAEMFANFDQYQEVLKEMDAGIDGWAADTASVMRQNTKTQEELFNSAADAAQQSIGNVFLPAYNQAMAAAANFATSIGSWVNEHQTAVQWIGILAASVAGLIVAVSGAALAFAAWNFVVTTITSVRAALAGLMAVQYAQAAVTRIAAGAQMLFNAVMALNPVGWVVGSVLALIAALGFLISTCPSVSAALSAAWNDPQGAVHGFCELVKSLVSDAVNYVVDRWETLKSALSNPIEAAINFFDHGSVVGGNVQSGEQIRAAQTSGGNISAPAPILDTSTAQAGVNELGNASNSAAQSTQDLANQIETNSSNAQTLNQNITAIGEGANLLQASLTATGEGFNSVGQNALTTSTELTNLQNAATQATPPTQTLGNAATQAAPPIQTLGSAASSASGSLSQISSAAGSVAGALSSKAAEISSIHISVPTVSTVPVAANAEGGIYRRGAFLTTFAEKSPEAAIPLDNSKRSKELWTKAGKALGTLPGSKPQTEKPNSSIAEKIYQRRVEEVQKMQKRRQKNVPPQSENVSRETIPQKISQVEKPKLTQEEQKILQNAAEQMQKTGRATLPPPTENSSAEYRRRYEKHQKIQAAIDYNEKIFPQTQTRPKNFPQQKNKNSTSIYSRRPKNVSRETIPTAPNFNPTIPRQNKFPKFDKVSGGKNISLPSLTAPNFNPTMNKIPGLENIFGNIFGKNSAPQIDKIFSGSVKLPQLEKLPPLEIGNDAGGTFGGVLDLLNNIHPIHPQKSENVSRETLPPITVSITIQGNANADTMKTAGQELAVDLRKQLDDWWNEKQHDLERRSFVWSTTPT